MPSGLLGCIGVPVWIGAGSWLILPDMLTGRRLVVLPLDNSSAAVYRRAS